MNHSSDQAFLNMSQNEFLMFDIQLNIQFDNQVNKPIFNQVKRFSARDRKKVNFKLR